MRQKIVREIKLTGTEHRINEFFSNLHRQSPYSVHYPQKMPGFYQALFKFENADTERVDAFINGTHFELQVSSTPADL